MENCNLTLEQVPTYVPRPVSYQSLLWKASVDRGLLLQIFKAALTFLISRSWSYTGRKLWQLCKQKFRRSLFDASCQNTGVSIRRKMYSHYTICQTLVCFWLTCKHICSGSYGKQPSIVGKERKCVWQWNSCWLGANSEVDCSKFPSMIIYHLWHFAIWV